MSDVCKKCYCTICSCEIHGPTVAVSEEMVIQILKQGGKCFNRGHNELIVGKQIFKNIRRTATAPAQDTGEPCKTCGGDEVIMRDPTKAEMMLAGDVAFWKPCPDCLPVSENAS